MNKIRISATWDTSENLTNRLIREFKTPDIDLTNVEFVFDDSYDTIIFFNHVNLNIKENGRGFIFPHEPYWVGAHQKNIQNGVTMFGFKKELYQGNCIETLSHTYYGGRGPWVDSTDFWNYDNLISMKFDKTKNISSSITKLNTDYGDTCLYPQRFKISNMIEGIDFVDVYGGSTSPKKQDALINYKFNISIENAYSENWITEKFYDSILTDTIPIYFGCKNIKEIYPEDGYILIEDINDLNKIKELLNHINENADQIYSLKINGLNKIKERYFKEYNLLKKIIEL